MLYSYLLLTFAKSKGSQCHLYLLMFSRILRINNELEKYNEMNPCSSFYKPDYII